MKRLIYWYVAGYLLLGGTGLAFAPQFTLDLLLSNGAYGDIMPRAAGMLMIMLGSLIALMAAHRDYRYYVGTILVRSFAVGFLLFLYLKSGDPFFVVLQAIVLLGLLPSIYVALRERGTRAGGG